MGHLPSSAAGSLLMAVVAGTLSVRVSIVDSEDGMLGSAVAE
jgi:hypothetical protein